MRSGPTPTHERTRSRSRTTAWLALATLAPTLAAGFTLGVGLAAAPAANAAPANCATAGLLTTCTFEHHERGQEWTVPAGVRHATFTVIGAWGGASLAATGGAPGGAFATLATTPGQVLQLFVGERGGFTGQGGWNGGGIGHERAGGGGGASDLRVAPYGLADRILVAGGGGGAGGHADGDDGWGKSPQPGRGGSGGGPGQIGHQGLNVAASPGAGGGGGGTLTAGGFGGGAPADAIDLNCVSRPALAGDLGSGGSGGGRLGGQCAQVGDFGGGGGGGWYGGGGGGGGHAGGAGGGGGSGYGPPSSTSTLPGTGPDDGHITITYRDPSTGWVDFGGGGQLTSAPTAVLRPAGLHSEPTQDVFYLDTNSQVIQRVVTDGVPGPEHNLGAVLHRGSTVAAVWRTGGRLDLFGRGTENALWQRSFTMVHGWGPWTARTAAGTLTSSPTVASPTSGRLDVYFRGTDNLLKQFISTYGVWAAPKTLDGGGPAVGTAPAAVVTHAPLGRVSVYAGCNGALCEWSYDKGGVVYFWGTIPASSTTADPTASSSGPGRIQVSVRDNANDLVVWQRNIGVYQSRNLGPAPSPGPSIGQAPVTADNTILYARGTQGTLLARTITS